MPRKKYGMKFELLPRPTKDEDGKPLLYARPSIGFKYTTRRVDDYCVKYRGAYPGDLSHFLELFMDVAAILMSDGSRVETPFGSFAPKLKLDGDHSDPDKVKHSDVSLGGIEFIPSKRFEQELDKRIIYGFLKTKEVVERHPLTKPEELEEALQSCLSRGYTTAKRFSYKAGLRYMSAKRFLDALCKGESPRLQRFKEGTTYHYVPLVKEGNKD